MTLEERVKKGMTTDQDAELVAELVKLACWAGLHAEDRHARKRGCRCWNQALADQNDTFGGIAGTQSWEPGG